jgi:importin subunit beta-1
MQAIEFWSTVCDCETSVLEDISDGDENATPYLKLVERAAPMLVPIMLETLTKQHVRTTLGFSIPSMP